MADYELTEGADRDLSEIARYTIETWGVEQARRYAAALERHFKAIRKNDVLSRTLLKHRPDLRFSRCEHHYIFYTLREHACPLILAVFHERMELMTRLRERLGSDTPEKG